MIGFWYVFFHTDYTILDNLFGLLPFIQTVTPHDKILLCRLLLLCKGFGMLSFVEATLFQRTRTSAKNDAESDF